MAAVYPIGRPHEYCESFFLLHIVYITDEAEVLVEVRALRCVLACATREPGCNGLLFLAHFMAKEESQLGLQGSLTPQRVDHLQR